MTATLIAPCDLQVVILGIRAEDGVWNYVATDPVTYVDAVREVKRWQGRLGRDRVVFARDAASSESEPGVRHEGRDLLPDSGKASELVR